MKRDFGTSTLDLKVCSNFFTGQGENNSIIVNDFLNNYHSLLDMFLDSLPVDYRSKTDVSLTISRLQKLKSFLQEAGGLRCLEYLNEYEKYLSIHDYVSCRSIEKGMFEELDNFKETFVSMIA